MATFKQSRSMPGRMKGKGTQELFSEIEIKEGDRERDFQHSLAFSTAIMPRTTTIHAQKILPGKTKDSCARSQPVAT